MDRETPSKYDQFDGNNMNPSNYGQQEKERSFINDKSNTNADWTNQMVNTINKQQWNQINQPQTQYPLQQQQWNNQINQSQTQYPSPQQQPHGRRIVLTPEENRILRQCSREGYFALC